MNKKEEELLKGIVREALKNQKQQIVDLKNEETIQTFKPSAYGTIEFGKGFSENQKCYYFKRISNNVVKDTIVFDERELLRILNFLTQELQGDSYEDIIALNHCRIKFKGVDFNKNILLFTVENDTMYDVLISFDELSINGYNREIPISSQKIHRLIQKQIMEFPLPELLKEKNIINIVLNAKTKNGAKRKKLRVETDRSKSKVSFTVSDVSSSHAQETTQSAEAPQEQLIDYRSFIIYTNNITCKKLGHSLSRDSAVIKVCQLTAGVPYIQQFEIPVCKCNKCRALYISEETYKELKSKGNIMVQLLSQKEFDEGSYNDNSNTEHVMHKCGYNVKADGLSIQQRHILLEQMIQSKIITQSQAVNHLKNLIRKNRFRSNMSNAISKWEDDIEYLTGQRLRIGVKAIVISKDIKKCNMNNYPY